MLEILHSHFLLVWEQLSFNLGEIWKYYTRYLYIEWDRIWTTGSWIELPTACFLPIKSLYCSSHLACVGIAEFVVGKKPRLPSVQEGLTERGTVQPVTLERDSFLQAQVSVRICAGSLSTWWFVGGKWRGQVKAQTVLFSYSNISSDSFQLS